ncbi:Uncharacterized protein GBIM_00276 [Gryllus bimaculatus]|nr:Uncharacterized protein GBIM_00276 [Gryllus bimaculatus]
MPIIEGVGDEVIQFFIVIMLILIGIIAWRSTGLSERQIIRTVLILERRSRHQVLAELPTSTSTPSAAIENNIDTGQETSSSDEVPEEGTSDNHARPKENDHPTEAAGSSQAVQSDACLDLNNSCRQELNVELAAAVNDLSSEVGNQSNEEPLSSVLRQRRLAFFQSRQETLLDTPNTNDNRHSPCDSVRQSDLEETLEASSSDMKTPLPGNIRIRLKYLNDDQKLVEGRLEELLGDFKRRHFGIELAADKLVRLIFNGQVLQRDSDTLQSLGLFDNCVVHCLVHQQRTRSSSNTNGRPSRRGSSTASASGSNAANEAAAQRDWDLGNLLFFSLSVLLGIAWYCRYQYAALFNTTTTVALAGMTGVLVVSLVGLYLPDPDFVRH